MVGYTFRPLSNLDHWIARASSSGHGSLIRGLELLKKTLPSGFIRCESVFVRSNGPVTGAYGTIPPVIGGVLPCGSNLVGFGSTVRLGDVAPTGCEKNRGADSVQL